MAEQPTARSPPAEVVAVGILGYGGPYKRREGLGGGGRPSDGGGLRAASEAEGRSRRVWGEVPIPFSDPTETYKLRDLLQYFIIVGKYLSTCNFVQKNMDNP